MLVKKRMAAGHRWLTPVILATQEAEIRSLAWASSREILFSKIPSTKKGWLNDSSGRALA
jgi:hypothetical protein